jgi:hypothetical protein
MGSRSGWQRGAFRRTERRYLVRLLKKHRIAKVRVSEL